MFYNSIDDFGARLDLFPIPFPLSLAVVVGSSEFTSIALVVGSSLVLEIEFDGMIPILGIFTEISCFNLPSTSLVFMNQRAGTYLSKLKHLRIINYLNSYTKMIKFLAP